MDNCTLNSGIHTNDSDSVGDRNRVVALPIEKLPSKINNDPNGGYAEVSKWQGLFEASCQSP